MIISDAFRYEAVEELTRRINGKYRMAAELEPMPGVLPGYTALGMAALPPHETLAFKECPNPDVLVDGKRVARWSGAPRCWRGAGASRSRPTPCSP